MKNQKKPRKTHKPKRRHSPGEKFYKSGAFWTAIGAIAAVVGVIVTIVFSLAK